MFHSCGASLDSTNGIIRIDGTGNDIIITNNIFGAVILHLREDR